MEKPLKFAALSAVCVVVLSFISAFIGGISTIFRGTNIFYIFAIFELTFDLAITAFGIFFFFGFIVLAKKFDVKILKVVSWIFIVIMAIGLLVILSMGVLNIGGAGRGLENFIESRFDEFSPEMVEGNEMLQEDLSDKAFEYILILFVIVGILLFIYGVLLILFGIGILKLGEKVELSKPTGILNIITGACLIVPLIGWFFAIFTAVAAYILEIILLFKASKKYEK